MGASDQNGLNPTPCDPPAAKTAPAVLPGALAIGAACIALSLLFGVQLLALLLVPAKEAGVRGHALGLTNPFCFILPVPLLLPAAGISIWALIVARRGDRKWLGRSRLLAIATFLLLTLHLVAFRGVGRSISRYASGGGGSPPCVNNLTMLSAAVKHYARDHGGQFPDTLSQVVRSESLSPSILVCTWVDDPEQERLDDGFRTSFVYLGKGRHESLDPKRILIYERTGIHEPRGAHVVCGDGAVEWVSDLHACLESATSSEPHNAAPTSGPAEHVMASP